MPEARAILSVTFPGPSGRLAGLLHRPARPPSFLAVVSHPHPLYGGTMDNKVTYRAARALEEAGALALRFNFRGVRGSDGEHDDGEGEQDDLRAAIAFARAQSLGGSPLRDLPLLLAGFSFGSVMSARVACADAGAARAAGLLLVGAPVLRYALDDLKRQRPEGLRVACVQGGRDEHGPLPELERAWEDVGEPKRLVVIPSAGHFFDDEQQELFDAVATLARDFFAFA